MTDYNLQQMTPAELRKFGITTGIIVALLFGLLLPWLFSFHFPLWPWYLAGGLIGLGLVFPISLGPVYRIWMKFGHVLGWINTRIILGILFYIVVLPMGLLMRLFGNDPMDRKPSHEPSYRKVVKPHDKDQIERPF